MKPDYGAAYREEARELLSDLEAALLELEESPDDRENIGRVFRALHTIKGSGAMFGFDDIVSFTHQLESAYDLVREEKVQLSKEMIVLTLSAGDHIRSLLEDAGSANVSKMEKGEQLLSTLRQLIADRDTPSSSLEIAPDNEPGHLSASAESANAEQTTYRIRFRPSRDILSTGSNPFLLLEELHDLGTCTITAQTEDVPLIENIDPVGCFPSGT